MNLSAVIVCVNYGDFLAHTLPQNKTQFDETIVVTTPRDVYTQAVCEFNNVRCITTDVFYENGASFNKAKGINEGFKALSKRGWILHIDADIWLPSTFRVVLENAPLNTDNLYGVDRMMCPNYDAWVNFLTQQKPVHEAWVYQHMDFFPMGERFIQYKGDGYIPLGYFQLFHKSKFTNYPEQHMSAARTDIQFSQQWQRKNRQLLPEVVAIHLESEERADQGINWSGRKTIPFGPIPEDYVMGKYPSNLINKDVEKQVFWKLRNARPNY